jgi:hypothetical protein
MFSSKRFSRKRRIAQNFSGSSEGHYGTARCKLPELNARSQKARTPIRTDPFGPCGTFLFGTSSLSPLDQSRFSVRWFDMVSSEGSKGPTPPSYNARPPHQLSQSNLASEQTPLLDPTVFYERRRTTQERLVTCATQRELDQLEAGSEFSHPFFRQTRAYRVSYGVEEGAGVGEYICGLITACIVLFGAGWITSALVHWSEPIPSRSISFLSLAPEVHLNAARSTSTWMVPYETLDSPALTTTENGSIVDLEILTQATPSSLGKLYVEIWSSKAGQRSL